MVAWGLDCGGWHMAVDWASVVRYDTGLTPCEEIITTTDHEDEPLEEAFWFAKNCAFDLYIDLERTVIVHVSKEERRDELLSAYDAA